MSNRGRHNPVADDTADTTIRPTVAAIRLADGAALDEAAPFAQILTPLPRAKRSREGETFFFVFSPASGEHRRLCRELREILRQTYWSASGSVTASLRRSISVANRYLLEHNLNADRSNRCYGGLACAVLRGKDLFLLQTGPVWACVLQEGQLRCFPRGEKLAHMGIGPSADVQLHHVFAIPGDTLLLAPYALLRDTSEQGLRHTLSLDDVDSIAAGLKQMSDRDCAALVARWESGPRRQTPQIQTSPQIRRPERSSRLAREPAVQREARERVTREPQRVEQPVPVRDVRAMRRSGAHERREPFLKKAGLVVGRVLRTGLQRLGSALSTVWQGLAAAGAGVLALVKWLAGAIVATIHSMLPGSRGAAQRRAHHPPPEENRAVMMAIAVALPLIILVLVLLAYRGFATESRLQAILRRAEEQIALAQAAGADSEEARAHWEQALEQVEAATTLQPDDSSIQTLQDQVRTALDELDSIKRLTLTQLVDFGSGNPGRRLVLHEGTLFVVDPEDGWAAEVSLDDVNREDTGSEGEDGSGQEQPVLVHTGQQVDGEDIGEVVDATWVDREEGRQSSALLVLAEDGQLISYDPAWRSESGAPQPSLLELNTSPLENPVAVGSFQGRFYVLDTIAEGTGQIWRYRPQVDNYPNQPERYFTVSPPHSLEQACDMAIDGHIYVLYQDGSVEKFQGGEIQPFEIRDVPGGLQEVSGFAVDPAGDGTVYLADRGHDRIVVLAPDGHFRSQFRTDPPMASLEAVAVRQADRQLYVLAGGQVYAAALP